MLRRFINPILIFPICFYINSQEVLLSETKNNILEIPQEKESKKFLQYSEIEKIITNENFKIVK